MLRQNLPNTFFHFPFWALPTPDSTPYLVSPPTRVEPVVIPVPPPPLRAPPPVTFCPQVQSHVSSYRRYFTSTLTTQIGPAPAHFPFIFLTSFLSSSHAPPPSFPQYSPPFFTPPLSLLPFQFLTPLFHVITLVFPQLPFPPPLPLFFVFLPFFLCLFLTPCRPGHDSPGSFLFPFPPFPLLFPLLLTPTHTPTPRVGSPTPLCLIPHTLIPPPYQDKRSVS